MHRLQLALCGGGGGDGAGGAGDVYIAQTLYLHSGWLPLATCTGGLVPSSTCTYTVLLHAQIATCTVMMVHGGGSGVIEGVPWDSSM